MKFELRQVVRLVDSGETGMVVSRMESSGDEIQYLVRYKAADGRAVEQWWRESALEAC